jgi:6-phosphofructokinase 1
MSLAVSRRNQVDPHGDLWMSVLEATGQPMRFGTAAEAPRSRGKRVAAAG